MTNLSGITGRKAFIPEGEWTGKSIINPSSFYRDRIQIVLSTQLSMLGVSTQTPLEQAIHYSIQNGGKRLRPLLVYATGELFQVKIAKLDVPACAIELIHTYSLIHDDLPAMDDDDYRRGKPACHKAFDEATAILAGDALQTLAFQCLSSADILPDKQRLEMIRVLSGVAGMNGMVRGQALDLTASTTTVDLKSLEKMYYLKTGALIEGAVLLGLIAADIELTSDTAGALIQYARHLGFAFQIRDDILDVEGNMETLGKQPGSDQKQNKPTFVAIAGMEQAKKTVDTLRKAALAELRSLDINTDALKEVVKWVAPV